jgi:hypothetical protein
VIFKLFMPLVALVALARLVQRVVHSVRGQACFVFNHGSLTSFRGECPTKLHDEFCSVARLTSVSGQIKVRKRGGLSFSSGFSPGQQQQFRNVFYLHHE